MRKFYHPSLTIKTLLSSGRTDLEVVLIGNKESLEVAKVKLRQCKQCHCPSQQFFNHPIPSTPKKKQQIKATYTCIYSKIYKSTLGIDHFLNCIFLELPLPMKCQKIEYCCHSATCMPAFQNNFIANTALLVLRIMRITF